MTVAFFGLLLCDELALNQLAFYLIVAVLIDTFVIRTMLVPAVMSSIGKFNWWPKMYNKVNSNTNSNSGSTNVV